MKVEGQNPSQGPGPLERASGGRKAAPKAGGKSFSDALGKARNASSAPKGSPSAPAAAGAGAGASDPPMDKHFDTIRFRLQSGYYNDPKVDDALSDKLSGLFDDFA